MKTSLKLITFALFSHTAFAQNSMELETITIRGVKDNKGYKESTSSITKVKSEQLEVLSTNNSLDALNGIGNVQVSEERGGGETFSIRGINNKGVTGFQKDSLASLIVDDVFQSDLAIRSGALEFWNMDSLEIHRGGQATTQGINSLAGNILLNHKEPVMFPEGRLKLGYGTDNRIEAGVNVNQEIIPGKLATRVTYNRDQTDGYITNIGTGNDKWGKKAKDNANVSFLYQLSETDKLVFDLKYSHLTNGGTYVQGNNWKAHEVNEDVDYLRKSHNQQGSVHYYKTLSSSLKNTLIVAYSRSKSDATLDADGGLGVPEDLGTRVEHYNDRMFTLENMLNYKEGKVNNTLGFTFHRYDLKDYHNFELGFGYSSTVYAVIDATQTQKNLKNIYSLYDSYTYDFNEHHSANIGLRLELAQNEYTTTLDGTVLKGVGSVGPVTAEDYARAYVDKIRGSHGDKKTKFIGLPKVGYVYKIENHNFGVSFSQAYRNGGVSVNRYKGTSSSYNPELTNNYELSHKFQRKNLRVDTNLFYIDWRKQQVQVYLSGRGNPYNTEIRNASSSEVYGAEVQAEYKINPMYSVSGSVGLVQTKFKDFKNGSENYTGNEFPDAPNYTGLVGLKTNWIDSFSTNLIGRFLGKSYNTAANDSEAPNQYYLDLTAQYVFSSYMLEVYGKNLLDKNYLLYDGTSSNPFVGIYKQTNHPREVGLRINYQW